MDCYALITGYMFIIAYSDSVTSECTPPSVSNAVYIPIQEQFPVDGTIAYICDTGYYIISGDAVLKCQIDSSWDGTTPNCSKCSNNEVGYENRAVDLIFNIDVASQDPSSIYKISRYNGANDTIHLIIIYSVGAPSIPIPQNGVDLIGNTSAGDLAIRIPSMNSMFGGLYVWERSLPSPQNISCTNLLFRARPSAPVILNSSTNSDGRQSVSGVEDKNVTRVCTSTGGYPKPNMAWYRTSNQTSSLVDNTGMVERDDRTYQLTYTFTTNRTDDGTLFICQTSFDPPDALYMSDEVILELSLKPSAPILTIRNPLSENNSTQAEIAACSTGGFRPESVQITWTIDGTSTVAVPNTIPSTNNMFNVSAVYRNTINRVDNGKTLQCSVNHTTLNNPLSTHSPLGIQFKPDSTTLSGNTSGIVADVGNIIKLNCSTGSSNPRSNITWYKNDHVTDSNPSVLNSPGEYNGVVTSQELEIVAVRGMDGDQYRCEVHNILNIGQPVGSTTKTLDLLYHPLVDANEIIEVTEGEPTSLRCEASSKPAPTFRWYHNGADSSIVHTDTNTASVLSITVVNRTHSGIYKCNASNGYPPDGIKDINLAVKFRPLTATLSGQTTNIVVDGGNTIKLNCTSGSSNPKSTITWIRNGTTIQNTSQLQEYPGEYNGIISSQILEFVANRSMDGEEVSCSVKNDIDSQNPVSSENKALDLLFHPIANISDGNTVIEGDEKTFQCEVQSKPDSTITWHHENTLLSNTNLTQYTIPKVNRSHAGRYRCQAVNGYLPDGDSQTNLIVHYTPDVEVSATNVTVNDTSAQVTCSPSGVPANYTFSAWQYVWPGHGTISHRNNLGSDQTLTLTELTYEYSGIYTCSVGNGIDGSLNPNAGHGSTYLKVETYPIITTHGDIKVSGSLNNNANVSLDFYSNTEDNTVECFKDKNIFGCSAVLMDGEIELTVFDTTIRTMGSIVKISLPINSVDQFGFFIIRIGNRIGSSERIIEVKPEGPPDIPRDIVIEDTQSNSILLSWMPGFHGGFNQTFVVQYSTDGDTWVTEQTVETHGGQVQQRINGTIPKLNGGTLYFIRMVARNEKGQSDYTEVFNVTTAGNPGTAEITSNDSLPAIAGGIAAGLVVILTILILVWLRRRHLRYRGKDKGQHGLETNRQNTGEDADNGRQDYYNINRSPYEDLRGIDKTVHTYGVLGQTGQYEDLHRVDENTHAYGTLNNPDDTLLFYGGLTQICSYEDLHRVDEKTHAYGALNYSEDPKPFASKDETYENLRLSPLN